MFRIKMMDFHMPLSQSGQFNHPTCSNFTLLCNFMCFFKFDTFAVAYEQTSHFLFSSDETLHAFSSLTWLNVGHSELERVSIYDRLQD